MPPPQTTAPFAAPPPYAPPPPSYSVPGPGAVGGAPSGSPAGRKRGNHWKAWLALILSVVVLCVLAFIGFSSAFHLFKSTISNLPGGSGSRPIVVDAASAAPPWTIQGSGYVFTFDPVQRGNSSACPSGPLLTLQGTIKRTASPYSSLSYDITNQAGYSLTDAGTDVWRGEDPPLGVTYPVTLHVCGGTSSATRLTITITDFFNDNGSLILKNIPVPTAR
jgi:hypothetical protein